MNFIQILIVSICIILFIEDVSLTETSRCSNPLSTNTSNASLGDVRREKREE